MCVRERDGRDIVKVLKKRTDKGLYRRYKASPSRLKEELYGKKLR